jgi:hypothetical protein
VILANKSGRMKYFTSKLYVNAKSVIIKKILYWMNLTSLPIHIVEIEYSIKQQMLMTKYDY